MLYAELEKLALELPEEQRAQLANRLMESLPAEYFDDPEGVAEARRRSAEMDSGAEPGLSWEEFDAMMRQELGKSQSAQ